MPMRFHVRAYAEWMHIVCQYVAAETDSSQLPYARRRQQLRR